MRISDVFTGMSLLHSPPPSVMVRVRFKPDPRQALLLYLDPTRPYDDHWMSVIDQAKLLLHTIFFPPPYPPPAHFLLPVAHISSHFPRTLPLPDFSVFSSQELALAFLSFLSFFRFLSLEDDDRFFFEPPSLSFDLVFLAFLPSS